MIYFRTCLPAGLWRRGHGAHLHRGQVHRQIRLIENVVHSEALVKFARGDVQAVAYPRERGEMLQAAHADGRGGRRALAWRAGRDSLGPVGRPR